MSTRPVAQRIADGEPLIDSASAADLIEAVVQLTHRLHDVVEDQGKRSKQADDLRAQRRRTRAVLLARAQAGERHGLRQTGGNRFIPGTSTTADLQRAIFTGLHDLRDWFADTDRCVDVGAISIETQRIPSGLISVSVTADSTQRTP